MARPVVKEERSEQILDAFETCVARYGLEGATLAKTAEEAGLARALIRHNIGNREDLQAALMERFLETSRSSMDRLIAYLPASNRSKTMVEWLFDPSLSSTKLIQISNAFIIASASDNELAEQMRDWLDDFVSRVETILSSEYPSAPAAHISAVAAGITGTYFNVEALYALGDIQELSAASKASALLLIKSLEQDK